MGGHIAQLCGSLPGRTPLQLPGDPLSALLQQQPASLDAVVAYSVLGFLPPAKLLPFMEAAASRLRPLGLLIVDGWDCTGGDLEGGSEERGAAFAPGTVDPLMVRYLPGSALTALLGSRFDLTAQEQLGVFGSLSLLAVAATRKP